MSTTFLATLYKFFSIAGIAHSASGCPQVGTVLSESCVTVSAQDASGAYQQTFVKEYTIANGSCGTYTIQDPLVEGVCGHPPNGWSVSYVEDYLSVSPVYWTHPNNPQAGQLAYAGGSFVYQVSNTYVDNWPATYTAGSTMSDQHLLVEVIGIDGWRLQIRFTLWNNYYEAIEDNLNSEGMPDPNPTP